MPGGVGGGPKRGLRPVDSDENHPRAVRTELEAAWSRFHLCPLPRTLRPGTAAQPFTAPVERPTIDESGKGACPMSEHAPTASVPLPRGGPHTLLTVSDLTLRGADELRRTLADQLRGARPPRLVLDLRGVDQVDAVGLGALLRIRSRVSAQNGCLHLLPSEPVQRRLAAV